jgi:uncharacterized protein YjbI with pentapeptide repeats
VWERLCEGVEADFNHRDGKMLDPLSPAGWDDTRLVSTAFLETMLLQEPYRSALPRQGVQIVGARFEELFALEGACLGYGLHLGHSRFERGAQLSDVKSRHGLSFEGSYFAESLTLSRVQIEGQLNLSSTRCVGELDLDSARIERELVLSGAHCESSLNMNGLEAIGGLFMGTALEQTPQFKHVDLMDARIGGLLSLRGAHCTGSLNMTRLEVKSDLFMDSDSEHTAEFKDVDLSRAQIGGQLQLNGARCTGQLNMTRLEVKGDLTMDSQSEKIAQFVSVNLAGAQIGGQLTLRGTHCTGSLNMNSLEVGGQLRMSTEGKQTAQFTEIDLGGARIGGQLVLRGACCKNSLKMYGLEVKSDLFMDREGEQAAQFRDVNLTDARIAGQVNLCGARCTGSLNMARLEVKGDLLMQTAQFTEIDLTGARVGGQLNLHGTRCDGPLHMGPIHIAGHVFMVGAEIIKTISLTFSRLDGSLILYRAHVASLDLTGVSLQGELHLGVVDEIRPRWAENAKLSLRNATIGAIQCPETLEAWPALELGGCTYQRLGGLSVEGGSTEMVARSADWYKQGLAKDPTPSKQPYHQVASVLRNAGHPETADAVLYAGSERERRTTGWRTPKWWGMSLLKWTIGYGYGYRHFRSLLWVLGITLVGAMILGTTPAGREFPLIGRLAYSFDLLLPIIELDPRHSLEGINGWPRYYFYGHELLGYVLAAFVAAGLSGITKK